MNITRHMNISLSSCLVVSLMSIVGCGNWGAYDELDDSHSQVSAPDGASADRPDRGSHDQQASHDSGAAFLQSQEIITSSRTISNVSASLEVIQDVTLKLADVGYDLPECMTFVSTQGHGELTLQDCGFNGVTVNGRGRADFDGQTRDVSVLLNAEKEGTVIGFRLDLHWDDLASRPTVEVGDVWIDTTLAFEQEGVVIAVESVSATFSWQPELLFTLEIPVSGLTITWTDEPRTIELGLTLSRSADLCTTTFSGLYSYGSSQPVRIEIPTGTITRVGSTSTIELELYADTSLFAADVARLEVVTFEDGRYMGSINGMFNVVGLVTITAGSEEQGELIPVTFAGDGGQTTISGPMAVDYIIGSYDGYANDVSCRSGEDYPHAGTLILASVEWGIFRHWETQETFHYAEHTPLDGFVKLHRVVQEYANGSNRLRKTEEGWFCRDLGSDFNAPYEYPIANGTVSCEQ